MSGTPTRKWSGIGGGVNLRVLLLDNLEMSETELPDEFYSLTNLIQFEAKSSYIGGSLGSKIGDLENLENLNLYYNQLQGKLPTELGKLKKLKKLELSENMFTGHIPNELNELISLTDLAIHNRLREGDGLTGPLPSFDKIKEITSLTLDSNSLTGDIPDNFLAGFAYKRSKRIFIGLSENLLSGGIPVTLADIDHVFLDVVGNKITGLDADVCAKVKWMDGEVGKGGCNAILCPPKTFSYIGLSNSFVNVTCTKCSSNEFYGAMECDDDESTDNNVSNGQSERDIMVEFFYATGGKFWVNNTGWDSNGNTVCEFHGVKCNDEGKVRTIRLPNNMLSGQVPSSTWMLAYLNKLNVNDNPIDFDFDGIEGSDLNVLFASNTSMTSFKGIKRAKELRVLDISLCPLNLKGTDFTYLLQVQFLIMNNVPFDGRIPTQLGSMTDLTSFYCSNCGFYGNIPTEIGNLSNLEKLNLRNNLLSSKLPDELGGLKKLRELILKNNAISGELLDFKDNEILFDLDLSDNEFTGSVPSNLLKDLIDQNANKLIDIDLSFNQLTGPIPKSLYSAKKLNIDLGGNAIGSLEEDCPAGWMRGQLKHLVVMQSCANHISTQRKDAHPNLSNV